MTQAIVIINPSSGKEEALDHVRSVEELLRSQGYEVTVRKTQKEGDATDYCIAACEAEADLVVSIGGDGTLHETINGLSGQAHQPKLGIIPLGTVNDFARALQIPLVPEEAIRTLASSRVQQVDAGRINGSLFVNVVAAGKLAESLSSVSSVDKSRLGALAYFKEGIKELAGNSAHSLTVQHDGETWEGEAPLFLAALTNSVGGFEKLTPEAAVDDGLIHCYIIKDLHFINTLTVSLSLLLGNLKSHKDVEYFTAREVTVSSAEAVRTNVDGEEGPALPVVLSIIPRHIRVVVPEQQ
ncbi:diacylglycerol kinase family protein [Paenibacillus sp. S150]|uniref:diacylglycerol/lipid kinase family protein n=1 Tax=Paenibacillus sp. S150 TaxID=2749826 RepID=UPI001C55B1CB|nr:diacylglycerol kinase family protein [Paenibacillus sp. S150]MBW4084473.1 diacylglycerol kinase family lipid kinase [Paenibacillus sp. S150]